jgi:hypothetical protein
MGIANGLDGQQIGFLDLQQLVDFADDAIGELLEVVVRAALVVL